MIVNDFLVWAQSAKTSERSRAANALARAYCKSDMDEAERNAAIMAMTYLLDDPSPRVRLALAEGLADATNAPRAVMLGLADDQPEIAGTVLMRSPVFTDHDLVEFASRGDSMIRTMISCRHPVSKSVVAAICEIGMETEIETLLQNPGARFSGVSLFRICNRFGSACSIRNLLIDRDDLPAAARHLLVEKVSADLCAFQFVQEVVGERNVSRIAREAQDNAIVGMIGEAKLEEITELVEHLRETGTLTPRFLMHALCTGKIDFFAEAIVNLTGQSDAQVRSIMARGGQHPLRALYERAGLGADIIQVFIEATDLWRQVSRSTSNAATQTVSSRLLNYFSRSKERFDTTRELMDMVEKLSVSEHRLSARTYADGLVQQAA